MTALPLTIGKIHFTGIGGIGMSGIAEILADLGYDVQGSDISENNNVRRLRDKGIPIAIPQKAENLDDVSIVVISTAIKPDNVELLAARAKFIPVVHRAEMLGELMRLRWSVAIAGTHGKTTTTSLVATLLDAAQIDPTVINGGIIQSWGSNAKLGSGKWMVVEADESDGSFARLKPTAAIVTNIDPEHLDHHGTYENLELAFENFVSSIPFYGFASLCIDHAAVQRLLPKIRDRRLITYGESVMADVRAVNIRHDHDQMLFDLHLSDRLPVAEKTIQNMRFPMLGMHNVQNAMAAISVAIEMGIDVGIIRKALANFKGVGRRFDIKGQAKGITVIDDYGHHPVEIKAALNAGRMKARQNRLIAVIQPHRYSRLRDLFDDFCSCFNDADMVIVADIYAAGEQPIDGYGQANLVAGLQAYGHRNCQALPVCDGTASDRTVPALAQMIADYATEGDIVMCLGAGSITSWAAALPKALDDILPEPRGAA